MRGTAGKILIVLGIILVAAAILWWDLAVNALIKIPSSVDTEIDYEGEYTYYVDPVTFVPLPPGTGQTVPMEAILVLLSLDEDVEYYLSQTEESVDKALRDAKKGILAIAVFKLYIPLGLLVLGALMLITGLFINRGRAKPAEEQASRPGPP